MKKRVTIMSALVVIGIWLLIPFSASQAATEMTIATFHPRTGTAGKHPSVRMK